MYQKTIYLDTVAHIRDLLKVHDLSKRKSFSAMSMSRKERALADCNSVAVCRQYDVTLLVYDKINRPFNDNTNKIRLRAVVKGIQLSACR